MHRRQFIGHAAMGSLGFLSLPNQIGAIRERLGSMEEASEGAVKDLQWHSWAGKLLGTNPLEIEKNTGRPYTARMPIMFPGARKCRPFRRSI